MSALPADPLTNLMDPTKPKHFRIENVPGYFIQSDPKTDADKYDYRKVSGVGTALGLVNRPYDTDVAHNMVRQLQWVKFETWLNDTNANSGNNTAYKVLYMERHGEGEHNVAEAKYGTPMWDVSVTLTSPEEIILTIIQEYYSRLEVWKIAPEASSDADIRRTSPTHISRRKATVKRRTRAFSSRVLSSTTKSPCHNRTMSAL